MSDRDVTRRAGVLVPLFSIPTRASWGIGEIADLPAFSAWVRRSGLSAVQLLPINEMAEGQSSPYSALSAMAIDPIFIAVHELPEFVAAGEDALTLEQREQLDDVRRADAVRHGDVRALKIAVLRDAFARFVDGEWRTGGPRADAMRGYVQRERWWLDDYALFRALHAEHERRYWIEWPDGIRQREPGAIAEARRRLEREILFYTWLQWIAGEQWAAAHAAANVEVFGDFPFMVSGDSADVWSRQHEFRVEASVGVPPDAFSDTGQDWGLPAYRWDVHEASGYEWLRQRARRCAELFDGFRVDHLVGFYRTYVKELDGTTSFFPPEEDQQRAQGERLMRLFQESGATLIAEDLGTVPDFVRESLGALGLPGLKVVRWERDWDADDQPFRDPAAYPVVSVAISGTHDTETVAEWWENAEPSERAQAAQLAQLQKASITPDTPFGPAVRDAFLEVLFASASELVLVPVQDVFGWRDRVNVPAVVDETNWSWRMPWPADRLASEPEALERADHLRQLAARYGRQAPNIKSSS
jgi:4-alpha-glucanotransferase